MTQDDYLRRLKAAILEGKPSGIAELHETNKPGAGVVQVYVLPDGSIVDFSSDEPGFYTLPDGQVIEIPGLRPPERP